MSCRVASLFQGRIAEGVGAEVRDVVKQYLFRSGWESSNKLVLHLETVITNYAKGNIPNLRCNDCHFLD